MSMWEMEEFVELGVNAVGESDMPVAAKRNLIYTLYIFEQNGDCGFTNMRSLKPMVNSQYTFLFNKEEMFDYKQNRNFYDDELPAQDAFDMGDIYIYEDFDDMFPEADGKICVDSGSPAWEAMVQAGKITGEGAEPVTELGLMETLKTVKDLLTDLEWYDEDVHRGLIETFYMNGGDEILDDISDEDLEQVIGATRQQILDEDFDF